MGRNTKMKHSIYWFSIFIVLWGASCSKKYGYNFEQGYNKGDYEDTVTLIIDHAKIDYSKYTQARLFPGLMSEKEPRLENYAVHIDLNYEEIRSSDLRISVAPGNWQSTGVYAPAGELIVVEVPAGIYGLTGMIGAHVTNNANGIDFPQRDLNIVVRQVLFPGKNYMRNLYGGLFYILPARPLGRSVELKFTGVAKAPSFKLGETTNAAWKELLAGTTVPWFELEGRRIVFTMETSKLKRLPIDDPTLLLETWDNMIRGAYWEWTGMTEDNPDIRHRAPFNKWRIVHDVLFKTGVAQYSGYPVHARNTENYFKQATDIEGVKYLNWGTYHELGHNMQMNSTWNFSGNGEVTCNLFHFKVSLLNDRQSYKIAEVWHKAVPYIEARKTKGTGADITNWASMDVSGNRYRSSAHDIRLMMFAQIFEKYGYEFMAYIYKRAREARFTSANNQSKIDFFYEALSEYTQIDMEPYCRLGWGIYVSDVAKRFIREEKRLPLLKQAVWEFNPASKTGGENGFLDYDRISFKPKGNWSITANNHQRHDNFVPAKMIDDKLDTFWHSCYNSTCVGDYFGTGQWVVNLDMAAVESFSGLVFNQRQQTNGSNHIRELNLQISTDGNTWTDLGNRTLTRDLSDQYIHVDEADEYHMVRARFIRLTIQKSGLYNTSNYAAIAELGVFTLLKP